MSEKVHFRTWHEHGNGPGHEPPQMYLNLADAETGLCEFCEDESTVLVEFAHGVQEQDA